jgi:hypothetical protein
MAIVFGDNSTQSHRALVVSSGTWHGTSQITSFSSNGSSYMSTGISTPTINPKSSASKYHVTASIPLRRDNNNTTMSVAIYRSQGANSSWIQAASNYYAVSGQLMHHCFDFIDYPGVAVNIAYYVYTAWYSANNEVAYINYGPGTIIQDSSWISVEELAS